MFMKSFMIAAMRGRNPENPSERAKSNGNYRQTLEPNRGGYLIPLLRFRKTTSLLSTSLNLSRESEPKQKNSEDICTEIREQSFLPDRWCQERTE